MYKLKENKIDDFVYSGSQLMNKEGNTFEYVIKNNQLHILQNMETGEMERFTTFELRQMYGKEPLYYFCEFAIGESPLTWGEWQAINGQRYLQLDAWKAVCGAYDALEIDLMPEEEKNLIMLKLWDTDNHLVGIFGTEEIEEICAGNYEPWKEKK